VLLSVGVFVEVLLGVGLRVGVRLGARVGVRVNRVKGVLVRLDVTVSDWVSVGKEVEVGGVAEPVGVWVVKGMSVWVGSAGERTKKTCIARKMATPSSTKSAIPKIQRAVFI
jgi:hypothetical protein